MMAPRGFGTPRTALRSQHSRGTAASWTARSFSPDGSRIVTAAGDGTVRMWDAKTGAALATLVGAYGPVSSVAFSPDGSRVVTASEDYTARLWDATSRRRARNALGAYGFGEQRSVQPGRQPHRHCVP